ncbi:trehalose-phosphatase [Corynebacterium sp. 335C]
MNDEAATALRDAIAHVAAAPTLLVALDFDGTLADLADDPMSVRPRPGNRELVETLAEQDGVTVMLLSGRQLKDLRYLSGMNPRVRLVGSHGAEPDDGISLSAAESALLEALDVRLRDVLAQPGAEGAWVENKPGARVLHVRPIEDHVARQRVLDYARTLARPVPGLHVTDGKDILEIAVHDVTKGSFLDAARRDSGVDAVVFVGDDVTDETALRVLQPGDLGVKVGVPDPEHSHASHFVPDTAAVTVLLRDLLNARMAAAE